MNVFAPIIHGLRNHSYIITTRRFGELNRLLDERRLPYRLIGGHQGSSALAKAIGTGTRTLHLATRLPTFDASIASLGLPSVLAARLRGRPAIGFLDGDLPTTNLRASAPFVSQLVVPRAFEEAVLDRFGLGGRAVRYDGFKEEIAASTYQPDPGFSDRIPFGDYVLLRPEALRAEYVPKTSVTIVPALLDGFQKEGVKVVYLPRYPEDRIHATGRPNVFVPDGPVNGLDACYHAKAVLTGSGTLAREAAVLGVPAGSFFPGSTLLSVDREMIRRSWMLHSRFPEELIGFAISAKRRPFDQHRCRQVLSGVLRALEKSLLELSAA